MNEKTLAGVTAKAIESLVARIDKLEARIMAEGFITAALMETHPDLPSALAALDRFLQPEMARESERPEIARAAQDRARRLADAYRRHLEPPAGGE